MLTVAKTAAGRERGDVLKDFRDAFIHVPELNLSHPWRVDDEGAARQHHELPMRRRVTAARVGLSHSLIFSKSSPASRLIIDTCPRLTTPEKQTSSRARDAPTGRPVRRRSLCS